MVADLCSRIRSQLMFYIDNELKEDKRIELLLHLNHCDDCQKFFDTECETKKKICDKLKDAYICKCDVQRLQSAIQSKISKIIHPRS